jgi:hypothetical protein
MKEDKILYSISVEDDKEVSEDLQIPFKEKDLDFIQDKIGDFMDSKWFDAIDFALSELKNSKK